MQHMNRTKLKLCRIAEVCGVRGMNYIVLNNRIYVDDCGNKYIREDGRYVDISTFKNTSTFHACEYDDD